MKMCKMSHKQKKVWFSATAACSVNVVLHTFSRSEYRRFTSLDFKLLHSPKLRRTWMVRLEAQTPEAKLKVLFFCYSFPGHRSTREPRVKTSLKEKLSWVYQNAPGDAAYYSARCFWKKYHPSSLLPPSTLAPCLTPRCPHRPDSSVGAEVEEWTFGPVLPLRQTAAILLPSDLFSYLYIYIYFFSSSLCFLPLHLPRGHWGGTGERAMKLNFFFFFPGTVSLLFDFVHFIPCLSLSLSLCFSHDAMYKSRISQAPWKHLNSLCSAKGS